MTHKKIDWGQIRANPSATRRREVAEQELDRVGADFMISDALINSTGAGLFILQCIHGNIDGQTAMPTGGAAEAARRPYKLRVLRDKWGNPPKPGTKIEWLRGRRLRDRVTGKKITIREIRDMDRRGELRTIEDWGEAIIDDNCCIELAFHDAATLLNTRGVHYASGAPITGMKEKASEPTVCPDGKKRTQHYWLYEEVPPWAEGENDNAGDDGQQLRTGKEGTGQGKRGRN